MRTSLWSLAAAVSVYVLTIHRPASAVQRVVTVRERLHSVPNGSETGCYDLDQRVELFAALRRATAQRELVLLTSDANGMHAAAGMAARLQALGIGHIMVLADCQATCEQALSRWPWLGCCGWSRGLGGFGRYADARLASEGTLRLWRLWSAKWLLMARLCEARVNVLALDSDIVLLGDPYPVLLSEPVVNFTLVVPPEASRVNIGLFYVRGVLAQRGGGTASVLWDVVRRLRLFLGAHSVLRGRRGRPVTPADFGPITYSRPHLQFVGLNSSGAGFACMVTGPPGALGPGPLHRCHRLGHTRRPRLPVLIPAVG